MIASGAEGKGQSVKQRVFCCDADIGTYAVMHVRQVDKPGPERLANGLFAQADSQDTLCRSIPFDQGKQDARFFGDSRSGGEDDPLEAVYRFQCNAVVAMHFHLGPQFLQQMQQIVGEGIVII